jgi:hypothetical protein
MEIDVNTIHSTVHCCGLKFHNVRSEIIIYQQPLHHRMQWFSYDSCVDARNDVTDAVRVTGDQHHAQAHQIRAHTQKLALHSRRTSAVSSTPVTNELVNVLHQVSQYPSIVYFKMSILTYSLHDQH